MHKRLQQCACVCVFARGLVERRENKKRIVLAMVRGNGETRKDVMENHKHDGTLQNSTAINGIQLEMHIPMRSSLAFQSGLAIASSIIVVVIGLVAVGDRLRGFSSFNRQQFVCRIEYANIEKKHTYTRAQLHTAAAFLCIFCLLAALSVYLSERMRLLLF